MSLIIYIGLHVWAGVMLVKFIVAVWSCFSPDPEEEKTVQPKISWKPAVIISFLFYFFDFTVGFPGIFGGGMLTLLGIPYAYFCFNPCTRGIKNFPVKKLGDAGKFLFFLFILAGVAGILSTFLLLDVRGTSLHYTFYPNVYIMAPYLVYLVLFSFFYRYYSETDRVRSSIESSIKFIQSTMIYLLEIFALVLVLYSLTLKPRGMTAFSGEVKIARARESAATLCKAVSLYNKDKSKPVEYLYELVPSQMYKIPEDPWGNVYRIEPYLGFVYSLGPNGKNDKGFGDDVLVSYLPPSRLTSVEPEKLMTLETGAYSKLTFTFTRPLEENSGYDANRLFWVCKKGKEGDVYLSPDRERISSAMSLEALITVEGIQKKMDINECNPFGLDAACYRSKDNPMQMILITGKNCLIHDFKGLKINLLKNSAIKAKAPYTEVALPAEVPLDL